MGAPRKADWREERRKRAWALKREGWKQKDIAAALGVSEGAVSQWIKQGREGGEEALKAPPAKGATPRLRAEQKARIPEMLARGAPAYGFVGEVWNSRRLAQAMKVELGVSYHPDHCSRLVREMGYSLQKPVERATQRDEEAIERWKEHDWPMLKKKPSKKDARSFLSMNRAFISCRWQ